jgi:membrane protease YdiL (CAAX protease family)
MSFLKNSLNTPWVRVIVYFIIIWSVTAIAWTLPQLDGFFTYLIAAVLATWILLKLSGQNWRDLNLLPKNRVHYRQLFLGTLTGIIMLLITAIPIILLTDQHWRVNNNFRLINLLSLSVIFLISSVSQEVTYRGYPFQTLLHHYGSWVAQSAIILPFAFMHFHEGMSIYEIGMMIFTTGLGSLLYGQAYINTNNLALPIGLHWGWNLAQVLFPRHESQNGNGFFIIDGNGGGPDNNLLLIMYLLVTLISYLILFFSYKKDKSRKTLK